MKKKLGKEHFLLVLRLAHAVHNTTSWGRMLLTSKHKIVKKKEENNYKKEKSWQKSIYDKRTTGHLNNR